MRKPWRHWKGTRVHLVEGSGGRYVIATRVTDVACWQTSVCLNEQKVSCLVPAVLQAETLQDLVRFGAATFATYNGATRRAKQLGVTH